MPSSESPEVVYPAPISPSNAFMLDRGAPQPTPAALLIYIIIKSFARSFAIPELGKHGELLPSSQQPRQVYQLALLDKLRL